MGANVGQTALRIHAAFPNADIFSFEPTPAAFADLRAAVGHLPKVHAHDVAVGPKAGTAEFFLYANSKTNSLVSDAPHRMRYGYTGEKITVAITTIDEFCAEHRIDHIGLLKIDTEGADLAVLQGARRMIAAGQIDYVYVEFNDIVPMQDASGGALAPICEFLAPFGMHFVASYTDHINIGEKLFVVCNALVARQ